MRKNKIFDRNLVKVEIMNTYKYTYPITRYGELETTVTMEGFRDDEMNVMSFYDRKISDSDRKRIIKEYGKGKLGDTFEYILNYLDSPNSHSFSYKDIMGDCQFYEGLTKIGDNHYFVKLGS